MNETLIVILIVCVAAGFIFKNFYKTLSGKSGGCGCGPDCGSCASGAGEQKGDAACAPGNSKR